MDEQQREKTRVKSLFDAYLHNLATPEEERELMLLIRDGQWKDLFEERIGALLENETVMGDMKVERASQVLSTILRTERKQTIYKEWPKWMAAAAAVAIVAFSGVWVYNLTNDEVSTLAQTQQTQSSGQKQAVKKIDAAIFSGKQLVRLPDGSTALLNENSELAYTAAFGGEVREVTLIGEAYFDIAHDEVRPFLVRSGKITTRVLGTAFNVAAWPGEKEIKVTVTRGRVKVSTEEKPLGVITPNQQIAFNKTTLEFIKRDTPATIETAWKEDFLIMDNVSLETAAALIEKKYDTRIVFVNEDLKRCRIEAEFFNHESLRQVLDVMKGVMKISYEIQSDGNVVIDGKGCN